MIQKLSQIFRKRKVRNKRKEYVNKLLYILEHSNEYKEYVNTNEEYKNYIESNALLKVWKLTILDTFDNKAMNKLIKKISKLSKKKYKVELNYRTKKIKDLNYFNLQYTDSSTSTLAKIEFLDDKFIRKITAGFTQINNNQAVVEFEISFNKVMDDQMFLDFIKENKKSLCNKSFIGYYRMDKDIMYKDTYRKFNELIGLALQSKLMEITELNYGLSYKLPSLSVINYPDNEFKEEELRDLFLMKTYEIRNGQQYLITDITGREGLDMSLCFTGNTYSPIHLTSIISNYRMDFYYFLFGRIEDIELEMRMNKYFNESKDKISSKDYKWLVNKIRAINDNKLHLKFEKYNDEVKDWKALYGGEEKEIDFVDNKYTEKYKTVYIECLEHIKVLYADGKDNLIIRIALLTFFATCITVILTLL